MRRQSQNLFIIHSIALHVRELSFFPGRGVSVCDRGSSIFSVPLPLTCGIKFWPSCWPMQKNGPPIGPKISCGHPGVRISSLVRKPTMKNYYDRWTTQKVTLNRANEQIYFYRPRSEGDNVIGSVCRSVCPSVRMCVYPSSPA